MSLLTLRSSLSTSLLLLMVLVSSQTSKYCPSSDWVECAPEGDTCYLPPSVTAATVSFGVADNNKGHWSMVDVSNTVVGQPMSFPCKTSDFGDPTPGVGKGCCYNIQNAANGQSTNEANWQFVGVQKDKVVVNEPTMIRFGVAGHWTYRYMQGTFVCNVGNALFLDVSVGNTKNCFAFHNSTLTNDSFIQCGDEKGSGICNTDVVPGDAVKLIRYGAAPNFYYRYLYGAQPDYPCNNDVFGEPNAKGDNFCAVANATLFVGALGSWSLVASCAGQACIINQEIEYGVTSTTAQSCTKSWTKSLSKTVEASLSFGKTSLTTTQSQTVSNTVSSSYSKHSSLSCGAVCGNGSADNWSLYQFVMSVGEYSGADIVPFGVNACNYVCSTSQTPPQCPPSYCTPNTQCTKCTGYP